MMKDRSKAHQCWVCHALLNSWGLGMLMFDPVLPPVVCVCVCVHVCYMQPQDVVKHRGRKWKEEVMDENVLPVKKPDLIDLFGTPAYRR